MVAQAGGNLTDAGPMQEADGRVAQGGHGGRPLMEGALVLAQGHILDAVEAMLAGPLPALEGQEAIRRPCLGPQAGDPIVQRPLGLAVLAPSALQVRSRWQTWASPGQSR